MTSIKSITLKSIYYKHIPYDPVWGILEPKTYYKLVYQNKNKYYCKTSTFLFSLEILKVFKVNLIDI